MVCNSRICLHGSTSEQGQCERQDDQDATVPMPNGQQRKSKQGIHQQNVAIPQQNQMQHADDRKDSDTSRVCGDGRATALRGA
jgi:hypothetical protein